MNNTTLRLCIDALEVLGPGLPGWGASRPVLAGEASYHQEPVTLQPPPQLSPAERRRTVPSVRLALSVGSAAIAQSGHDPGELLAVFASSGADGDTIAAILAALNTPTHEVSPTRFHNSVHNAPSGYWSLATHSREASTSISCHDFTFAAGLLEAGVQAISHDRPVLLVAYDLPYPSPLHEVRPITGIFGIAMVVRPAPLSGCSTHLALSFAEASDAEPDSCAVDGLETLRRGNPAARALPLLTQLARNEPNVVRLELFRGALEARVHVA